MADRRTVRLHVRLSPTERAGWQGKSAAAEVVVVVAHLVTIEGRCARLPAPSERSAMHVMFLARGKGLRTGSGRLSPWREGRGRGEPLRMSSYGSNSTRSVPVAYCTGEIGFGRMRLTVHEPRMLAQVWAHFQ